MTPLIRVRPGFLGAHFAMVGPALVAAFLLDNLAPACLWIAASALIVCFGKEI